MQGVNLTMQGVNQTTQGVNVKIHNLQKNSYIETHCALI